MKKRLLAVVCLLLLIVGVVIAPATASAAKIGGLMDYLNDSSTVAPECKSGELTITGLGNQAELTSAKDVYPEGSAILTVKLNGSTVIEKDLFAGGVYGSYKLGDIFDDLGAKYGDKIALTLDADNGDGWSRRLLNDTITVDIDLIRELYEPSGDFALVYTYDEEVTSVTFGASHEKCGNVLFFDDNEITMQVGLTTFGGVNGISYSDFKGYADIYSVTGLNTSYTIKFDENAVAASNPYRLHISTNEMTITKTADDNLYTIRAYAGVGGSITPSGAVSIRGGADQTFLITVNEGYVIDSVNVDGEDKGKVIAYTFPSVNADHSIVATFKLDSGDDIVAPGASIPSITSSGILSGGSTIPQTGAAPAAFAAVSMLLAAIAVMPKRRG